VELATDLPPLSGTNYQALTDELLKNAIRFNLAKRVVDYGKRPLTIVAAERGIAQTAHKVAQTAHHSRLIVWPTDQSFSDKRVALSEQLVRWLDGLSINR